MVAATRAATRVRSVGVGRNVGVLRDPKQLAHWGNVSASRLDGTIWIRLTESTRAVFLRRVQRGDSNRLRLFADRGRDGDVRAN